MPHILAINYSQTGQLNSIIKQILLPLQKEHNVEWVKIEPTVPYPFPWTGMEFFDLMPECVLEHPIELKPYSFERKHYNLIIIGYQPWFLSPSLPSISLFSDPAFCALLKDTPVVTVVGSRNMWLNSQKVMIRKIEEFGGYQVGNIPLADRSHNLVSGVTILHWQFKGRKDSYLGLFPTPGISESDIKEASSFGTIINKALVSDNYSTLQEEIVATGKIPLTNTIIFIEERAKAIFRIWAKAIDKQKRGSKQRTLLLTIFECYLVVLLFIVSPIVLMAFFILVYPFCTKRYKQKRNFYLKGIIRTDDKKRVHYKNLEVSA